MHAIRMQALGGPEVLQRLHASGAVVVGAAGGDHKVEVVRDLGADVAVDYTQADWTARAGAVDVLFDGVGGPLARAALGAVARGGRLVAYGAASGDRSAIATEEELTGREIGVVRFERPTPGAMVAATARALADAAAGRWRPVIGQRFPLDRAADAHRAIENRATVGKTLLVVGPAT